MNPTFKVVACLAVIAGCASWLFYYQASQPAPGEPVRHRAPVSCASCGQAYDGFLGAEPSKCVKCGEKSAWRALKCTNKGCGAIFPRIKDGSADEDGREPVNKCTKCGKSWYTAELTLEDLANYKP